MRRIEKRVRDACGTVDINNTIFVAIYAYRDNRVADTINDLFDKAICPRRVFVGVYQHNARNDSHCMERYQSVAKYTGHPVYSDNVRVLTGTAHEAKGRSWPHAMIFRTLYQNEKYSLILDPGARLCAGWDEECLKEYANAVEMNSNDARVLITQPPPRRTAISTVSGVHGLPTYHRFAHWKDSHLPLPVFDTDTFKHAPLRASVTFTMDLSFVFAPSTLFIEVPFDPRLYYVDKADLEWFQCVKYWTYGWTAFTPTTLMCVRMPPPGNSSGIGRPGADSDKPPPLKQHLREYSYHAIYAMLGVEKWPSGTGVDNVWGPVRTLQTYMQSSGINVAERTVSDSALLGLWHTEHIKNAVEEETVSKYGSYSDAMYARERFRSHWVGDEEQPYMPYAM